jgi:hypothetical protein
MSVMAELKQKAANRVNQTTQNAVASIALHVPAAVFKGITAALVNIQVFCKLGRVLLVIIPGVSNEHKIPFSGSKLRPYGLPKRLKR